MSAILAYMILGLFAVAFVMAVVIGYGIIATLFDYDDRQAGLESLDKNDHLPYR